jgi:hypothetical protein
MKTGFPLQWCGPGSNRRHKDFQSFALPTELPHHLLFNMNSIMFPSVGSANVVSFFELQNFFKNKFEKAPVYLKPL